MPTTTNYGWTTPADTDLVKDGAAAIRTLGSSIDTTTKNLNPETSTGDISYRSATANINTRLALGTAGQVLSVNSGATAPEWKTLAINKTITEKATGTFSGSTTTLSGLTDDTIMILASGIRLSSAVNVLMRLNGNSSSLYYYNRIGAAAVLLADTVQTSISSGTNFQTTAPVTNSLVALLTNCKETGYTTFQMNWLIDDGVAAQRDCKYIGYFRSSTQITSVTFELSGATFSAGNWTVLGG